MKNPVAINLKEYQKPEYEIDSLYLTFNLDEVRSEITSKMKVRKIAKSSSRLFLNGEQLHFISALLNGEPLTADRYLLSEDGITILNVPDNFTLEITNTMSPVANKALEGLYKSGNILCTQCEPEGFRRITYYIDRPDVMTKFTTKLIGDKRIYPIMLSNGNLINHGDLDHGKHFAVWEDPFKKPSYLYALVAGDLGVVKDSFVTRSNRHIPLYIYCDKGNESRCHHAMESLKKSMRWDEERFGLEYDLDIFMIVAVDSFNMGAMENKGLNIFNSAYILADEKTAVDDDFDKIESVVGHEYFHNWTGNRITCRDWFQLTLKEGLTVYRDQEFSADMNDATLQRISDVTALRKRQFPEDAGPNSHPIKPESYITIDNFYTATIYEKGAEVIRMVATLLGREGFRRGMDKYFELYDGMAVTTEDFINAMSVANENFDFSQFKLWYSQSGTPTVTVKRIYDQKTKKLTLDLMQTSRGQMPFVIPLSYGLLDHEGRALPITGLITMTKLHESVTFDNLEKGVILSINRGFSAPILLNDDLTFSERLILMKSDTDYFNRYEASQRVFTEIVLNNYYSDSEEVKIDKKFYDSYLNLILDKTLDIQVKANCLTPPALGNIAALIKEVDYAKLSRMTNKIEVAIAEHFKIELVALYNSLHEKANYQLSKEENGIRLLKNTVLAILTKGQSEQALSLIKSQYQNATNMNQKYHALLAATSFDHHEMTKIIEDFYSKWSGNQLVIQKWFAAQALSPLDLTYDRAIKLSKDRVFDKTIPNFVYALWRNFALLNKTQFHHPSGRGYQLIADLVLDIDSYNPQVAARIAGGFNDLPLVCEKSKMMMLQSLKRILDHKISKNVYEICSKIMDANK